MDVRADHQAVAEVAAQELLRAVRELGGAREGVYDIRLKLLADGSYRWDWQWWPPADDAGGSGGKSLP